MLRCQFCGATSRKDGRPFEKQGQLNLHEYHCKMKHHSDDDETENECEHEWRLLNLRQPIEYKANQSGYNEVCKKCQDLK